MRELGPIGFSKTAVQTSARPAVLFLLAASLLTLMSLVLEPGLGLPLMAFLAMAAVTRLLGLRLYQDITEAANQPR